MNRVLLIGGHGQVGLELYKILNDRPEFVSVGREVADLTNLERLRQVVLDTMPEIIINAAAYTAVDKAESEMALAQAVNTIAPQALAETAQKLGAALIHLSTDYVFDGKHHCPYRETDPTHPLSVYGTTKLAGEAAIRTVCDRHIILRTAWVYGTQGKSNFVKTMLRLGAEREELRVVADQIGSPTWAAHLAGAIAQLLPQLTPNLVGTYHYTNSGIASWYDFATAIFEEARTLGFPLKIQQVIPISTAEYPTPARRPPYSVLSCAKITAVLGTNPPHWRQGLRQMLQELYSLTYESADSLRR
ncbi:MAG: dTDP-4-dehydrorhamnose reductase [Scytolyngbya sp. HA4215-MV1]|jgi:dTDP-4-dehydrorhamnose reductase|nr:dTDP-4-dehydrorhamnose reductase [Scytolyngbya sp. HA4215-MV1]